MNQMRDTSPFCPLFTPPRPHIRLGPVWAILHASAGWCGERPSPRRPRTSENEIRPVCPRPVIYHISGTSPPRDLGNWTPLVSRWNADLAAGGPVWNFFFFAEAGQRMAVRVWGC